MNVSIHMAQNVAWFRLCKVSYYWAVAKDCCLHWPESQELMQRGGDSIPGKASKQNSLMSHQWRCYSDQLCRVCGLCPFWGQNEKKRQAHWKEFVVIPDYILIQGLDFVFKQLSTPKIAKNHAVQKGEMICFLQWGITWLLIPDDQAYQWRSWTEKSGQRFSSTSLHHYNWE